MAYRPCSRLCERVSVCVCVNWQIIRVKIVGNPENNLKTQCRLKRIFFLFFFFFFFRAIPKAQEVPRIGVESGLQPLANTTATTTHTRPTSATYTRSSWQHQILNPLSGVQGSKPHPHGSQSMGLFLLSHNGNSQKEILRVDHPLKHITPTHTI